MIRSTFAITRLLVLPYGALLVLYLLIMGGGGGWLYLQVRAVESQLVTDELLTVMKHAILLFGLAGGISILIALLMTASMIRKALRLESHFQEIYRRASVTDLAAELVHDLRNPLMALRTNVKALLVSPDQTREIAAELDRDIVALNGKLSGFLDLTRRHDAAFAPTDPRELIEDAIRLAAPALDKEGLGVELEVAPNLPWPALQAPAIRDALLNVIINAAQSGQTAGSIRISACGAEGGIDIAVEDRGEGIEPKTLVRLFDPFFTTKAEGNGLGLAIVKGIAEIHHGHVRAENRSGGGARVTLTLPLEQPEISPWWKA